MLYINDKTSFFNFTADIFESKCQFAIFKWYGDHAMLNILYWQENIDTPL